MTALDAVRARQSWSRVTDEAPGHEDLIPLIVAAGRVADHSSLRPWRLIELRGTDRDALGAAIAAAQGDSTPSSKPLRAPLLIAVVASYRKSDKVPRWEQEAVASGVAHVLSLLLDEAGWGVIWRTGHYTRSAAVARAHGLGEDEELLGWLYVGGKPAGKSPGRRKPVDARRLISRMPRLVAPAAEHAAQSPDESVDGTASARPGGADTTAPAGEKKKRKGEKKKRKSEKKRDKKRTAEKKAKHRKD